MVQTLVSLNGSYILSRLNNQRTYPSFALVFQWTWYEAGFARSAYPEQCGLKPTACFNSLKLKPLERQEEKGISLKN